MRVISGTARSLPLQIPDTTEIRPTIDRYRETVFNIINQQIVGTDFLDLFAGTGANGIEALSRGARHSWFVDSGRAAAKCIEHNLKFTKLFEKGTLLKYDYDTALRSFQTEGQKFDVVYLDPPFNKDLERPAIEAVMAYDLIEEDGIIICESSVDEDMSWLEAVEGFEVYKEKRFKSCKFTFIEKTSQE